MTERHEGRENPEASWQASPESEAKSNQAEASDPHKFNPDKRPGIPKAARFGKHGETSFHELAQLWDAAKAEFNNPGSNPEAIQQYETFSRAMIEQYQVLTDSMTAGREAIEAAGLTLRTPEGQQLYEETERKYEAEHRVPEPEFMKQRREAKKKKAEEEQQ